MLICLALAVDGCYGNYQEKLMRKYPQITNSDIAFYSYSFGTILILTWLVSSRMFLQSVKFVAKHNEIYGLAFVYSFIGYIGQQFVLAMMKCSGALVSSIGMSLSTRDLSRTMVRRVWRFLLPADHGIGGLICPCLVAWSPWFIFLLYTYDYLYFILFSFQISVVI